MTHDLVIRGGMIVDGTGLAAYPADLGIKDGRIAEIGRIRSRGAAEIDAEGHAVSPGFIDGHTHLDAQINWDPLGTSACWHGITTAVMGNCGFTLAPSRAEERGLVVRNLERAEDISPSAMQAGISWNWETFPEYLDALDMLPKVMNHAVYVGHSALRSWAMGERAFEQAADADDLARMDAQLCAGLAAGAMGLSTSRSMNHETSDDRPVASRLADWSEVVALVNTVGAAGGVFELALEPAMRSTDPAVRGPALRRLHDLAISSGAPITFGVTPAGCENDDIMADHLALFDATARDGGVMFGQSHSRDVTVLLSFRTTLAFDKLPEWREMRALPLADQASQLRDPARRAQLVRIAQEGPYGRAIGAEARKPDWNRIFLYDKPLPPFRSMASLAAARGMDPVELLIDLALESDFGAWFMQFMRTPDEQVVLDVMRHPRNVMTFSDTGAHVSQIVDCSIQSHLLAYWARERGAFTLEEAVRMITLAPARAWGFADRGLLREGMVADVNVFDPQRLAPRMPELVNDLPSGARRLIQRADGMRATIIGGATVMENGVHTGALPGQLLRRRAA